MRPLILVGGGGHCRSVAEAAFSSGHAILGVLDVAGNVGRELLDGLKIIGTDDDIPKYASQADFVITVGHIKSSDIRRGIAAKIDCAGGSFATIVASTAHVSRFAIIGHGSVILHGAMINAGAVVGGHCIINTLANVEHDSVIGDFCHISTGAMVNGDCRVEADVFLGSQSVLLNGASICSDCIVAAGSFVRKSITTPGIYAGNPAKLMIKVR